jgi:hypothetical protein
LSRVFEAVDKKFPPGFGVWLLAAAMQAMLRPPFSRDKLEKIV